MAVDTVLGVVEQDIAIRRRIGRKAILVMGEQFTHGGARQAFLCFFKASKPALRTLFDIVCTPNLALAGRLGPAFADLCAILDESRILNRISHARHQLLIIGKVDLAQDHRAQHFFASDQMMQIGP